MREEIFPPGDIRSKDCEENLWREMSFSLHLLRQSVNPPLSLHDCINDWEKISKKLAESPRKRKRQMRTLC